MQEKPKVLQHRHLLLPQIVLVSLVPDIVEVLPIISSRFVVTRNGGVVMLSVSLVSDIVERLPIISS
jgi:hypothetical protein